MITRGTADEVEEVGAVETAFFGERKITEQEAEELKQIIEEAVK